MSFASQYVVVSVPGGGASRTRSNAVLALMEAPHNAAAEEKSGLAGERALSEVRKLAGSELGMAVAREVMQWRPDHEKFTDCWVDANGKLTGYYYGRPFSPYRDRNALAEVWKRIDALGLRARFLEALELLLGETEDGRAPLDPWSLHTASPDVACRAALLAVRGEE